jgi:hypothetical protein
MKERGTSTIPWDAVEIIYECTKEYLSWQCFLPRFV